MEAAAVTRAGPCATGSGSRSRGSRCARSIRTPATAGGSATKTTRCWRPPRVRRGLPDRSRPTRCSSARMRGEFDAVIAPYHDVGMTAIKVASFGQAVNVTLGLPFPRTSPDHGTALDIAGQWSGRSRQFCHGDPHVRAHRGAHWRHRPQPLTGPMPGVHRARGGLAAVVILGVVACSIRHPGEVSAPVPVSAPSGARAQAAPPATSATADTAARVAQERITLPADSSHPARDGRRGNAAVARRRGPRVSVGRDRAATHRFGRSATSEHWTRAEVSRIRNGQRLDRVVAIRAIVGARARLTLAHGRAACPPADRARRGPGRRAPTDRRPATWSTWTRSRLPSTRRGSRSSVRGKWVMTRPPAFVWNPDGPAMTAADSAQRRLGRRASAQDERRRTTSSSSGEHCRCCWRTMVLSVCIATARRSSGC